MRHLRAGVLAAAVILVAACSPSATGTRSPAVGSPPVTVATPTATVATVATPRPTTSPTIPATGQPPASIAVVPFDPAGLTVKVVVVATGFDSPLDVANAGDGSGRVFVVEQAGRIRIVRDGALVERPFLDISGRIASGGERGLLGLAFHPDFPTDPRFFVDYTDRERQHRDLVVPGERPRPRRRRPRRARRVLLHIDQPFPNHNGGAVAFGPDGMLYIGMGDGGSAGDPQGNGQRLDTLLAKILRIDVDGAAAAGSPYGVPPDNPFVGGRRRPAGDLAHRPAQSVADPLRPGDRRPLDRRRRPGRVGGDRRRATPGSRRPRLRLEHDGGLPLLQAGQRAVTRRA